MMEKTEGLFNKICKGSTPFCIDLDDEDSYIVEEKES